MEVLLVRIDLLRDRKAYVETLRSWLSELALAGARLATTGELHLLLAVGAPAQLSQLLAFFGERPIDTDAKGVLCVDKFIDVLGRRAVDDGAAPAIKGFLEMNFLNTAMLEKMVVDEWRADRQWLETALATPRTSAFLAWRAASKAQRSERRKKAAQEKHAAKQLKQQEQEKAAAAAAADDGDDEGDEEGDAVSERVMAAATPPTKHVVDVESQDESDDASAKVSAQQQQSAQTKPPTHESPAKSRARTNGGPSRSLPQSKPTKLKQQKRHRKRREEQPDRPHAKKLAKVRK